MGDHVPGALAPGQGVRPDTGGHEMSLVLTGNAALAVLVVVALEECHEYQTRSR